MKKIVPFTGWALCTSAAIIVAGCARNQGPAEAVETPTPRAGKAAAPISKTPVKNARIKRSEGIPGGVETPSGLTVPKGFQVNVFAEGLTNPRRLIVAPGATPGKYDVFVA